MFRFLLFNLNTLDTMQPLPFHHGEREKGVGKLEPNRGVALSGCFWDRIGKTWLFIVKETNGLI